MVRELLWYDMERGGFSFQVFLVAYLRGERAVGLQLIHMQASSG